MAFSHNRFWASNCGCRERRGHCDRSRMDVCLIFRGDIGTSGTGLREISMTDALGIFEEASEKRLVARPYRNDADRSITDGVCFCCDDCCEYLINPASEKCDKGALIEATDMEQCTYCGDCADACHFGARKMVADELVVQCDNCYGCGLCIDTCTEKAITMIARD